MIMGVIFSHTRNEHIDYYCNDRFLFYTQPHFHITLVTESHERMFVASTAVATCTQRVNFCIWVF